MLTRFLRTISRFDTSHRVIIALIMALVTYIGAPGNFHGSARLALSWVVFALTSLLLMWLAIGIAHPRDLPHISRIEDSSRVLISIFVVIAAMASLFAVFDLLDSITDANRTQNTILAVLAVASAWTLVHTLFTLRYAHLFYGDDQKQAKRPGGLDFPNDTEPDYLDFAYFSFVIGMTSQVSDVAITSKRIRRAALIHGVLSFLFNTIIIALTVGGLSGKL
ncbi:DUF1345 domain-containing protein [Spirosoma sp. SC4-14]|uniref:DUF1345 domain-containing protein n=1 Tax=Spirosoma sp. SC4-14 TaxID=3128900 RepID=UPI0030D3A285